MKHKIAVRFYLYFTMAMILFSILVGGIFLFLFGQNAANMYKRDITRRTDAIANTLSAYFEKNLTDGYVPEIGITGEIQKGNLGLGTYLNFMDDIALSNLWVVDGQTETIHVEFGKYQITYSSIPTDVRQLIDQSLLGETCVLEHWAKPFPQKNLVIAAPIIMADGTVVGSVVVHARSNTLYKTLYGAAYALIGSLICTLLISSLPSYLIVRRLVRPLRRMAKTTSQLTEGNYTAQTGIHQQDEVGVLADNIDILAERLLDASKESEQLELMRKTYISNISHELRTPVAVIRSSLEALCDHVVTEEDMVEDYHQEMLRESIHLERMVNDLLELSRLKSPAFQVAKSRLDLCELLEDAAHSCHMKAQQTGHEIVVSTEYPVLVFHGDYGRLRQMLVTVLDNALKFAFPTTPVRMDLIHDGSGFCIRISNLGRGIAENDLPHIFEEYYTTLNKDNPYGSGLGLAIANGIAGKHDMRIDVTSVVDGETCFSFHGK